VVRYLRAELEIEVQRTPKRLPYVPTEDEIRRFYSPVWKERRGGDVVLIKTLMYTGVRVSELVAIRIADVDLDACRVRVMQGKGAKDRVVPFPESFKETLALHIEALKAKGAVYLFESSWKKAYTDRRLPASQHRSAPTSSGTSCSPGSRPRASMTRAPSPTHGNADIRPIMSKRRLGHRARLAIVRNPPTVVSVAAVVSACAWLRVSA
jgi:hypothetical protein